MESLSFRIPQQHPPADGAFDTRPAEVKRWVEELPLGNTGEAARRIFAAVREVNALDIPLSDRLEMMETLAGVLDGVLNTMEQHFSDVHFPIPAKSLKVAEVANHLLTQVVIAYQAVLNGWDQGSWLFRKTHSGQWALCIQRLVHYLGRILCNYRKIHRPYPPGVWLAVHRLFFEADKQGRIAEKIEPLGNSERVESIADCYKRVQLLALLEPQLFTRLQMDEVHRHMPVWLGEAELLSPEKWNEEMESYCIRLDEDTPHTVQAERCVGGEGEHKHTPGLLLDISGLGMLLDEALSSAGAADAVTLFGTDACISCITAEALRQCWKVPRGPRAERYKTDKPVQVAVGLSAIFSLMRERSKRRHDGITDQVMGDDLTPLLPSGKRTGTVKDSPSKQEVWDTIFYGTEVMQNSWAMGGDEKNYHFVEARELNYNERGYCLEFSHDERQVLDVGELLGFRESEDDKLQLCVVRWLQESDSSVLIGVRRLAGEMEPVLVLMEQEERNTALGCLLGIGEDGRPQLFLPHLSALHEHPLHIVVERREIPIILREKVSISPLFEGYHFSAAEELDVESLDDEMDLDQVNTLLHAIAHSDEQPETPKGKDDFSDLWDSL